MKSFDAKSSINGEQEHSMYQLETNKKGNWNGVILKENNGQTVQRKLPNTTYNSFMGTVRRLFTKKLSQQRPKRKKTKRARRSKA